jgi:hypothetical protein
MGKQATGLRSLPAGARVGRRKSSSKYRNEKVTYDGYKFDSLRECERYKELKLLEAAGEITALKVQPKFPLKCGGKDVKMRSDRYPNGRRVSYFGDFSYYDEKRGEPVVEDVKGADTQVSRLKRAFVEAQYGVEVIIVR